MRISIIGVGYVGKAMVNFFKDHYSVIKYDPVLGGENATKTQVNKCDLAVVCVPTPMAKDGSCDTSIVEEVVKWIDIPIWLRSTVSPGTTDRLEKRIVFSPEYLGESSYYTDWDFHKDEKKCPWFILGGEPKDRQYILDIIVPIAGPAKHYVQMPALEAEITKYMENIYFAMKVTFANEMKRACDALGANYWQVRDGWGLDPRVDIMHTAVFTNKPGFSGKCLPKDLNGFIRACEKVGYEPKFLKQIIKSNKEFKNE